MAEAQRTEYWVGRLSFVALAFAVIFVQLMPLATLPPDVAPPDVLLAALLVWSTRRPDYLPVAIVAILVLLTDLLFQRPPGLWAGLVLILTEMLRARSIAIRTVPFLFEWAIVSGGIIAITLINRLVLSLTVTPQPGLSLVLGQMVATCLVYPLIVFLARVIFKVTRPTPGEVDAFGRTI